MGIIGWLYPAMGYVNELESKSQLPTTVTRGDGAGQSRASFRLKINIRAGSKPALGGRPGGWL